MPVSVDGTVLVTGGAGFIGSHLVNSLCAAGARVTVLDNLQAGSWGNVCGGRSAEWTQRTTDNGLECVVGDVRDHAKVVELVKAIAPDYVFHMAANASVPGSVTDPQYDFESNAGGTFNVLDACRLTGSARKVVIASSGAVYGEPAVFPITEESDLAPISPYGASKLCAETVARSMMKVYGVPATIARIFNTYGPRMPRFVVLDFMRKLQANSTRLEILGNGRQVRDLNHVTDTVAGLMLLAESGAPGESYNMASGVSHTVTQVAENLLSILGVKGTTEISYTGESWPGDAQRWEVDISRAGALGYRPNTDLNTGLRDVIAWYESRQGLLPRGPGA